VRGATAAAVLEQEQRDLSEACQIAALNDGATLPLSLRQARAREHGQVGRHISRITDIYDDCGRTTAHGRLMLTVLGGLAEFERELIRARTGEGRERAKAKA
jgi:Resolvase, N terminal domain